MQLGLSAGGFWSAIGGARVLVPVAVASDGHPSVLDCRGTRLASVTWSGRKLPGMRKWRYRALALAWHRLAAKWPGLVGRPGGEEPGMNNEMGRALGTGW